MVVQTAQTTAASNNASASGYALHTAVVNQLELVPELVERGGDVAALMGMAKILIEADDKARARGDKPVLDHAFIAEHTHGFEEFAQAARQASWPELERRSGLSRKELELAANVYAQANAVIGIYGMGLTQHRQSVPMIREIVNFALLVYLVRRLSKRPLENFLNGRRATIERSIAEASDVKRSAEEADVQPAP